MAPDRRLAFCVGASGGNLEGVDIDCQAIHSLLVDPDIGGCDQSSPPPVLDCASRKAFDEAFLAFMCEATPSDQVVLFFSGHGSLPNSIYTLQVGAEAADCIPFQNIVTDLSSRGLTNYIVILDSCFSGSASKNRQALHDIISHLPIARGSVVIASSREEQVSEMLPQQSGSAFTTVLRSILADGLGYPTPDGLITPGQLVKRVNEIMSVEYPDQPQRSNLTVHGGEGYLWISRNRTADQLITSASGADTSPVQSMTPGELYVEDPKGAQGVAGAAIEDLDPDLLQDFARSIGIEPEGRPIAALAEDLGLLSPLLSPEGVRHPHRAAVLCFGRYPHKFTQKAHLTVSVRDSSWSEESSILIIEGPLPQQMAEAMMALRDILARNQEAIGSKFWNTIRELVSNALVHRDYDRNDSIAIRVSTNTLEVNSPGGLMGDTSWSELLAGTGRSFPRNPLIAYYMLHLRYMEKSGLGLDTIREYLMENGADSIIGVTTPRDSLQISVKIPTAPERTRNAETPVSEDTPTPRQPMGDTAESEAIATCEATSPATTEREHEDFLDAIRESFSGHSDGFRLRNWLQPGLSGPSSGYDQELLRDVREAIRRHPVVTLVCPIPEWRSWLCDRLSSVDSPTMDAAGRRQTGIGGVDIRGYVANEVFNRLLAHFDLPGRGAHWSALPGSFTFGIAAWSHWNGLVSAIDSDPKGVFAIVRSPSQMRGGGRAFLRNLSDYMHSLILAERPADVLRYPSHDNPIILVPPYAQNTASDYLDAVGEAIWAPASLPNSIRRRVLEAAGGDPKLVRALLLLSVAPRALALLSSVPSSEPLELIDFSRLVVSTPIGEDEFWRKAHEHASNLVALEGSWDQSRVLLILQDQTGAYAAEKALLSSIAREGEPWSPEKHPDLGILLEERLRLDSILKQFVREGILCTDRKAYCFWNQAVGLLVRARLKTEELEST